MMWIATVLSGCGSGSITLEDPTRGAGLQPTLSPVVEDPFSCERQPLQPPLEAEWVVSIDEYGAVPGNFAFSTDGSAIDLLAEAWGQTRVRLAATTGELLSEEDTEVLGFARSHGVEVHVDLHSHLFVDGVRVSSDLELFGTHLRVNERWVVVADRQSMLRTYDRHTQTFTELGIDVGWNGVHELALDGDHLWVLRTDEPVLERFDLRTGTFQTVPLDPVEDAWPTPVAGLAHGPEGLVYTTLDGTRILRDARGDEVDSWAGGFRMVNDQIYAQPWVAAPVTWSPDGRMRAELGVDGEVVVYQACNNDRLYDLEHAGVELLWAEDSMWAWDTEWTPPIGGLAWSPDGRSLAVRLQGGVALYPVPPL